VNKETKTAERGLTLEASNEIGGKTNALAGGPEHEFTRVQHEGVVGANLNEFGEVFEVLLHIDMAHRVVPENPEEPIDMKIDRGWLDAAGVEGLDNNAAGFDLFTDGAVREDHGCAG
jgi:hypothetical protein